MYRKIMVLILAVILCLTGCSSADKPEKTEDLEFTVVAEEEIPQELRTLIDSKKQSEFRLTLFRRGIPLSRGGDTGNRLPEATASR